MRCRCSSVGEHLALCREVAGSSPASGLSALPLSELTNLQCFNARSTCALSSSQSGLKELNAIMGVCPPIAQSSLRHKEGPVLSQPGPLCWVDYGRRL